MGYLLLKATLSGIIIMIMSEVAQKSPAFGGLIASLPLVSILGIIWLWKDTADIERVASHAQSTLWFVLPTLPMFAVLPALLRHGVTFWLALGLSCVLTIILYMATLWVLAKLGVHI